MKRLAFALVLCAVCVTMGANSRTASKLEVSNDPTTAREQLWYSMPLHFNKMCNDLDTAFSHLGGAYADSVYKAAVKALRGYVTVLSVLDSLYVTDDLEVHDDAHFEDSVYIKDDLRIGDSLSVADDANIGDDLTVGDDASIKDLTVTTTAVFTGATLTLDNDEISGDKIQGGTIGSTTITTLTVGDSLFVTDDAAIGDDVLIGDELTVTDSLFVEDIEVNTKANFTGATVTFDDNEISGDKVEGGTIAAITITAATLTDAVVSDSLFVDGMAVFDSLRVNVGGVQTESILAADKYIWLNVNGTRYKLMLKTE